MITGVHPAGPDRAAIHVELLAGTGRGRIGHVGLLDRAACHAIASLDDDDSSARRSSP